MNKNGNACWVGVSQTDISMLSKIQNHPKPIGFLMVFQMSNPTTWNSKSPPPGRDPFVLQCFLRFELQKKAMCLSVSKNEMQHFFFYVPWSTLYEFNAHRSLQCQVMCTDKGLGAARRCGLLWCRLSRWHRTVGARLVRLRVLWAAARGVRRIRD